MKKQHLALVAVALVLLTLIAFSGALSNGFLNYDDDVYVTSNEHVVTGLNHDSVAWAFTTFDAANWHPITWLSHLLDVWLFKLDPRGHHLTSVLIHAANVVLLFLLLFRMTGAVWRSALVAGLFAVHPLHVESVAWIAERKDVLSTLFWLLTLGAWLRWLDRKTARRYAAVVVLFALGLMAKPMLVTLPFTLMLLDVWPLKRVKLPTVWQEKTPLFLMSAASCVVTFMAQRSGGAVESLAKFAFDARLANAAQSYAWYLGKTFWPTSLACLYPYSTTVHVGPAIGSALLVVGLSVLAVRLARKAPYAFVSWAWYLGTLVPVIGLVQVGAQAAADRYTYVPLIGIFIAIAWGLAALVEARDALRYPVAVLSCLAIVALIPVTRAEVSHWHDNVTLFTQALAVTSNNCVAHNNLGLAQEGRGDSEAAIANYKAALLIKPDYVDALNNLAASLHHAGKEREAIEDLNRALAIDPNSPAAHVNLGNALVATGKLDEAVEHYTLSLRARPGYYDAEENIALVLENLGRHGEAIPHFEQALGRRPNEPASRFSFASALAGIGRPGDALRQFDAALQLKPQYPEAENGRGIALAALGRYPEALASYDRALGMQPNYAEALHNAGLALASMNRLPEAVQRFERAVSINPQFAAAHNDLAVTLARLNRVPEAIEHFKEAVRIDPQLDQARANLAKLQAAAH